MIFMYNSLSGQQTHPKRCMLRTQMEKN